MEPASFESYVMCCVLCCCCNHNSNNIYAAHAHKITNNTATFIVWYYWLQLFCSLFFRAEQQHESYCFCLLVVVMVHINNRLLSFKCSLVFVNLQLQLSSATCDGEKEEEVMSTDQKWPCFCFNDKFYVAGDHRLFPFSFFIFNKFVLLCFAFF